jgi:hypothetical protein
MKGKMKCMKTFLIIDILRDPKVTSLTKEDKKIIYSYLLKMFRILRSLNF